ncbi:DUF4010 domain-containing protein [Saccharopolyspora rhizosphaerae]|uniref:DUF4010 domain-containing protein n=1 Tax=Saccharopolyspora rhizosphaerae TaxID=2492662 RepID=A0A426JLT4_9PSEU|nr:DUF4010 domain-containing protein [Saccharopolyspora rhizosphaerae]RRO13967.1 DUF4010 domain-containing protein [Saccharopolyspora rhizosphaerae]
METTTALVHFATALAIGLLLGLEREHSTAGQPVRPAGSRTFSLLSLVGAVAAALAPAMVLIVVGAAGLLVIAWYVLSAQISSEPDLGATTEVAAIVAVLLGALAWSHPTWAVPIAVAVVALLAAKRPLHRFATHLVTDDDIADAIRLFVVAFVIFPLLPDRPLGPYGVLNPSRIWLLVIAITLIGWAGYVAVRALGERQGLVLVGFLGGFVSASATTVVLARRTGGNVRHAVLPAVLTASVATLVQLIALTAVVNPAIAVRLLPASAAGAAVLLGEAGWLAWHTRRTGGDSGSERTDTPDAPSAFQRPLSLRVTISLTLVLILLLTATRAAAALLGARGVLAAAFVGGLADAHSAAVAASSLGGTVVPISVALLGVGMALLSNTLIKIVLAAVAGGLLFATRLAVLLVLPAAAVAGGIVLVM